MAATLCFFSQSDFMNHGENKIPQKTQAGVGMLALRVAATQTKD
jgi:hypothetical protein